MATHEILILGGHHAGVSTAHYLLQHTLPALSKLNPGTEYHVTIVSPNTEFYWNIAAPRALINAKLGPSPTIWPKIADGFKQYDQLTFTHTIARAKSVDADKKIVELSTGHSARYDSLIIATGSSFESPLWQVGESEAVTKKALADTRELLEKAKTVLISGGGSVGVETAGEISATYGEIKTYLISGNARLLPRLTPYNSASAESQLKVRRVETIHNVRVSSTKTNPDGTTTVIFDNGEEKVVDVYINATGGKPNSKFLPSEWLDETGHVIVDKSTLRTSAPGVYAVGDVASYSDGTAYAAGEGVRPVTSSIAIDIATATGHKDAFVQKLYKSTLGTQIVPTGPNGGVGQLFGWWVPSILVWLIKSRTYFLAMVEPSVNGEAQKKA